MFTYYLDENTLDPIIANSSKGDYDIAISQLESIKSKNKSGNDIFNLNCEILIQHFKYLKRDYHEVLTNIANNSPLLDLEPNHILKMASEVIKSYCYLRIGSLEDAKPWIKLSERTYEDLLESDKK